MKRVFIVLFLAAYVSSQAGDLDTVGVTLLRQIDPTLNGNAIAVAQPESTGGANDFEVNPAAVGQPQSFFTWRSSSGTATTFPNAVGTESGHADAVGGYFYGPSTGVAPGVAHVDNYEADFFYNSIVGAGTPPTIPARVVNQSFIFLGQVSSIDQNYDDYADQHNTVFLNGAGNGGAVSSPATSYNGLGVGVYGAGSSFGPTTDGRCKPDITAPGLVTSYSTPLVSGAAAILVQAANRGDGGANTSAAGDLRTIKALLLNGAVKPSDWTNSATHPLDFRYGAGIVNIFNSWKQLGGGKQAFIEATSNASGGAHPPGNNVSNVSSLIAWDFNSITNARSGKTYEDRVHHYYFNVPPSTGNSFTLTATLVWNRAAGQSSINDLNLFLYNVTNGTLVAASSSAVDNVEHLFQTTLPPGRYDLQVMKTAAAPLLDPVETYALAFEAFNVKLNLARTNSTIVLSWPVAPTGFVLQSITNLSLPAWASANLPVTVTNNLNVVTVSATNNQRFFRLQRP